MTPDNPDMLWLPYSPRLPLFNVYANYTGPSCPGGPGQSTTNEPCPTENDPNSARRWIWTPVLYKTTSSLSSSTFSTAAADWNSKTNNKLSLASSTSAYSILLFDRNGLGFNGKTWTWGAWCHSCFNRRNQCGSCFNAAAVWTVQIGLDLPFMYTAAGHLGTNLAAYAPTAVVHELGHALRLGHTALIDGKCSEVKSIMYPSGSVLWGCGVSAPTACDTAVIDVVYPSPVTSCASAGNFCTSSSPSCS